MIFNFVGAAQGGGSDDNFQIAMHAKSGVISTTVSSIRAKGLWSNSCLTGVELPAWEGGGTEAFMSCKSLQYANAPMVTSLPAYTFYDCLSLSSISFPACVTVGTSALYSCNIKTTEGLPNVITVMSYAFRSTQLSAVDLQLCELVSDHAFSGCSLLQDVNLPKCSFIGSSAFESCSSLQNINIPVCETISSGAFINCRKLSAISLPACKTIGLSAFYENRKLSAVYLLSTSITTLAASAALWYTPLFGSSYLGYFGSIYVPSSLVDTYKAATNWSYYSDRITAYIE